MPELGHVNVTTMTPSSLLVHKRPTEMSLIDELKQRELEEFYSTYDVWTGIRTAITLALFFLFTVSIIAYKSRSKKTKPYDIFPPMEDVPQRPLDYCDYWCTEGPVNAEMSAKRSGMGRCYEKGGVGMGSAPLPTQGSVGSYSSLSNSFRVKSLPGSVMAMNWSRMSSYEKEEPSGSQNRSEFLRVPGVRLQSCGSSGESYGAGCSNHELVQETATARLGVPGGKARPLLQLGGMDWDSGHATAEWLQTIDINVIQPTPNISPCGSVRSVSDHSGVWDQLSLHSSTRSVSKKAIVGHEIDENSVNMDSVFLDEIGDNFQPLPQHNRRATQPNLFFAHSVSKIGTSLLGLPVSTHLSGSCEKLSVQPADEVSPQDSGNSLHATLSIEDDPQLVSFTVPNLRRTHSATTNGRRNDSMKARVTSPIKRADSANNPPVKRVTSNDPRKNSSGSTSSTDEASESVSFHLMVPQLSMDCPSQDVSRASSPSLSPTPPETPPFRCPAVRTRAAGTEGRGVLRRQFAKDLSQPCQQLPTYPEEEEPALSILSDFVAIRPPPGYRDPSPIPPLNIPVSCCPSPTPSAASPIPISPLPYALSPSALSVHSFSMLSQPMSPIPPPPSPLYASFPSPNMRRSHSPVRRTDARPSSGPLKRSTGKSAAPLLCRTRGVSPGRSQRPVPKLISGDNLESSHLSQPSTSQAFKLPSNRKSKSKSSSSQKNKNSDIDAKESSLLLLSKSPDHLPNAPSSNVYSGVGGSHPESDGGDKEDDEEKKGVSSQRSYAAMTPISIDIPDVPDVVHETSC